MIFFGEFSSWKCVELLLKTFCVLIEGITWLPTTSFCYVAVSFLLMCINHLLMPSWIPYRWWWMIMWCAVEFRLLIYLLFSSFVSLCFLKIGWICVKHVFWDCAVVQGVNLCSMLLEFHNYMLGWDLAPLLIIQIPVNALAKAEEDGPNACVLPTQWETQKDYWLLE